MTNALGTANSPQRLTVGQTYTFSEWGQNLGGWFSFWAEVDHQYTMIIDTNGALPDDALGLNYPGFGQWFFTNPHSNLGTIPTHELGPAAGATGAGQNGQFYDRLTLELDSNGALLIGFTPTDLSGSFNYSVNVDNRYFQASAPLGTKLDPQTLYNWSFTIVECDGTDPKRSGVFRQPVPSPVPAPKSSTAKSKPRGMLTASGQLCGPGSNMTSMFGRSLASKPASGCNISTWR